MSPRDLFWFLFRWSHSKTPCVSVRVWYPADIPQRLPKTSKRSTMTHHLFHHCSLFFPREVERNGFPITGTYSMLEYWKLSQTFLFWTRIAKTPAPSFDSLQRSLDISFLIQDEQKRQKTSTMSFIKILFNIICHLNLSFKELLKLLGFLKFKSILKSTIFLLLVKL